MRLQKTFLALMATAITVVAQDPPSRVARLSLLEGPVSFQPESVNDWTGASLNYPLTTGDHLYSDQGGRAELRIGPNTIRLSGQTSFGFLNLDDQTVQIRLTQGSINVRIRGIGDQDIWEVDTPNGAVSLLRAGDYRIDTDPARNATMVTVRGGEAEVTANGQSFPVRARQTAYFAGDGRQESVQDMNSADDFDRFSIDRDRREDSIPPPRYVSQQMVGYEDLDQYGSWEPSNEYGPVWRPRVRAGWSPYHDGRWAYREPWGWTWVDDAPWGFAPFHYGRWAYYRGGWGWCPGPIVVARPVYAPALVAFVGGGGFNLSINIGGGGGVGWFPLGPREIYAPAYRVSPRYVREVNYTNVREINNITVNNIVVNRQVNNFQVNNVYVNRNAPGAFTAVSRQDFVGSRQVQRSSFQGSPDQFRSAPVSGFGPGIAPQRESLFGRPQGGTVARPQQAVFTREVIARTPPPAAPIGFEVRQQAIRENGGRPLAQDQMDSLRGRGVPQPAVRSAISPGQGFGRNSGTVAPVQGSPAPNTGFGRTTAPQQQQPNSVPDNRDLGRQRDRGVSPQQAVPQVTPQTAPQSAPRTEPRTVPQSVPQNPQPDNRGFGRQARPETPSVAPPPNAPSENRSRPQDRLESRPPQQVTQPPAPRAEPPVQENRGFGRQQRSDQQPQDRPATPQRVERPAAEPVAPQVNQAPAPRPDPTVQDNRGFGRAQRSEQQQERPAAPQRVDRPAEVRPAREPRPEAEKPKAKDEKPKDEKPKEERQFQ